MRHTSDRPRAARRWLVAGSLALALASPTAPAQASPDSLRLALEDVTFGVVDVAASPVTAGVAAARNLDAVSDHAVLQALYALPGWAGLTFLQVGQGVLRTLVGALEVIPGIALFPFQTDLPEDWNVFRRGDLLVDARNPLGEHPSWLAWVLPLTPVTIDARIAPVSPWAVYVQPQDDTYGGHPMTAKPTAMATP